MNVWEKIQRDILVFLYQSEKNLIMVKRLLISLLIALDLCQPQYQNFLIIYLKFTAKGAEGVGKRNETVCDFTELKSNRLYYKCNKYKKDGSHPLVG